jgi:hypothetical protein
MALQLVHSSEAIEMPEDDDFGEMRRRTDPVAKHGFIRWDNTLTFGDLAKAGGFLVALLLGGIALYVTNIGYARDILDLKNTQADLRTAQANLEVELQRDVADVSGRDDKAIADLSSSVRDSLNDIKKQQEQTNNLLANLMMHQIHGETP